MQRPGASEDVRKRSTEKTKVLLCSAVTVGVLALGLGRDGALARERPHHVVGTNIIQLVQGGINLQYEAAVSPRMSLYVRPAVAFAGGAGGLGLIAGLRGYPGGRAPGGFWLGGLGGIMTAQAWGYSASGFEVGVNVGYKGLIADAFVIEGGVGVAYVMLQMMDYRARRLGLLLELNVGFAF